MAEPVIFQTPGTLDTATAAFFHSFLTAKQLGQQAQELQIAKQKAQSEMDLQGAQTSEAKARERGLDAQLQDLADTQAGNALAAGVALNHPGDPNALAGALRGIQPNIAAKALTHYNELTSASQDTAYKTALTGQANAQADAERRSATEDEALKHTVASYQGQDLTNPRVLARLAQETLAVSPTKAPAIIQSASNLGGEWQKVDGQNGDMYFVNPKTHEVYNPHINTGAHTGAGGAAQQTTQFAATQVYLALADMERLERTDPQASKVPVSSAAAQGVASLGAFGVKPFAGLAGPAAQTALSNNQQQFQMDMARLTGNYPSLLKNFRGSNVMLDRLAKEWGGPAGSSDAARALARRSRLQTMRLVDQMRQGKPIDMMRLPGYKDSLVGAAAEQGGLTNDTATPDTTAAPAPYNVNDYRSKP